MDPFRMRVEHGGSFLWFLMLKAGLKTVKKYGEIIHKLTANITESQRNDIYLAWLNNHKLWKVKLVSVQLNCHFAFKGGTLFYRFIAKYSNIFPSSG